MSSVFLCLVSFLTIFAITEQASKSLLEIEQILKDLAAQTDPKNRLKKPLYASNYSGRGYQQQHNTYQNRPNSLEAQGQGFLYQLNKARIQKQLEDDLEQAQRMESDRICKATGRCGCSRGRCGNPYRSKDNTVDDVEQILMELNEELHKNQNKNFRGDLDRQQYRDRDQDQNDRQQGYEENRQQFGQRQQYDERKQEYDDRKQEQEDRRQRRERYDGQRQDFEEQYQQNDDRRQRYDERQQERDERYERKRQQYDDDEEDNIDQSLQRKVSKYNNNDEFDIIVLEVPEKVKSNRNKDMKIIDVREFGLKDLLQK